MSRMYDKGILLGRELLEAERISICLPRSVPILPVGACEGKSDEIHDHNAQVTMPRS